MTPGEVTDWVSAYREQAHFEGPSHDRDEKARMKLPADLLTAHKAG
jgi:hypothetical protein